MKPKLIRIATVPLSLNLLLRGQLKMLSDKYEVVAVSSPGDDLERVARREGVRVAAIPMERHISIVKDLVSLYRLIIFFRKEKPDIVHSLTPKAGLLSMLAAWICRVPVRIHTFTGLVFPSSSGLKREILMATDKMTCYCATYINPEGEGVRNDLKENNITAKPLHIIGNGNINGIDLSYYCRTESVMTDAARLRDDTLFTFCYAGRITKNKGIDELISAFVKLHQALPQIRLWLIGDYERHLDPVSPQTREAIMTHPAIKHWGWINDIRPYLAASDALVFPSWHEGVPNVVLQAGAMGLPSIVTDVNGSNEIIRQGENGIIIPPQNEERLFDAMRSFATSPDSVKRYASAARRMIAQRYDREDLWKALLEVYDSFKTTQ